MLARARSLDTFLPPAEGRLAPVMERGTGRAVIAFRATERGTGLADLYQKAPLRVLRPRGERGFPATAVLVTTSGGLAGGDRLDVEVSCRAGAEATVTTQAAEKVYRSLGPDVTVDARFDVADGATLEWLPQETILFDRARLVRSTELGLAGSARLHACDMLTFGRIARGERFATGRLFDRWRIRRDGRLVWADALRLDGDVAGLIDRPFGFAGAEAMATQIYAGPAAAELLAALRERLAAAGCRSASGLVNGLLLTRLLGAAAAVRSALAGAIGLVRSLALGLPDAPPRVWAC